MGLNLQIKNFVNGLNVKIVGDDPNMDTAIYRYVPFYHIINMLRENKLRVYKAKFWEDPYELFFFKQHFKYEKADTCLNEYGDNAEDRAKIHAIKSGAVYPMHRHIGIVNGQSWTLKEESDAMWRIYSHNKDAIKIKTTIRRLCEVIQDINNKRNKPYVGKVQYADENEIYEWLSDEDRGQGNLTDLIAKSMFVKRTQFSHENEFRIIELNSMDSPNYIYDYISYNINPDEFIDEFCLDPRIDDEQYLCIRTVIQKLGVCPEKIKKSNLYGFHPKEFTIY